jgi:hypothetical protein
MKKYPISKFYYGIWVIYIIFMTIGAVVGFNLTKEAYLEGAETSSKIDCFIFLSSSLITIGLCVWEIFMDFPTGSSGWTRTASPCA